VLDLDICPGAPEFLVTPLRKRKHKLLETVKLKGSVCEIAEGVRASTDFVIFTV